MSNVLNERERELRQQLDNIEAALLTSFGPETIMLIGLQNNLRDQLGLNEADEEEDDQDDSYRRPVAA